MNQINCIKFFYLTNQIIIFKSVECKNKSKGGL